MTKLVLWDIDGTLLQGGGFSGSILRELMAQAYGAATEQADISYAGKTDTQIVLETYPSLAQETLVASLPDFFERYAAAFEERQEAFAAQVRVLPGVQTLLARLAEHAEVVQSPLTGNIASVAALKLRLAGLDGYLDLAVGAYGADHRDRAKLVGFALDRAAARHGRRFAAANIVVVGDTPNDIACGKAGGARTVAVATGQFSAAELAAHAPDVVLPDCADTEAALAALLGG